MLVALLFLEDGRERSALDAFRRALFLEPDNESARRELALVRARLGSPDEG
jgi:hypothetical protein